MAGGIARAASLGGASGRAPPSVRLMGAREVAVDQVRRRPSLSVPKRRYPTAMPMARPPPGRPLASGARAVCGHGARQGSGDWHEQEARCRLARTGVHGSDPTQHRRGGNRKAGRWPVRPSVVARLRNTSAEHARRGESRKAGLVNLSASSPTRSAFRSLNLALLMNRKSRTGISRSPY